MIPRLLDSPWGPRLMVITDGTRVPSRDLPQRLEPWCGLAQAGQVIVQLRDRQLGIRERLELGMALRTLTRRLGQYLVVNDRLDLALILDADGVHLGEASVEPEDARRAMGEVWISRATHDPNAGDAKGANALVLSPVLAPRKGNPALGLLAVTQIRERLPPGEKLYALGGVDECGASACIDAGADGVAAIGSVLDARDPRPLLHALRVLR